MFTEELPVFVAYRRSDGEDAALILHDQLNGRTISAPPRVLTLSIYHDQSAAAVEDWRVQHANALKDAVALIVVCSPDGVERRPSDHFHDELEWWCEHRPQTPPILVASHAHGVRFVPRVIAERWPDAQVVKIDPQWKRQPTHAHCLGRDAAVDAILSVIATRNLAQSGLSLGVATPLGLPRGLAPVVVPNLYSWAKNRFSQYVWCCENYAAAAGLDSPAAIVGKTDDDLPWWMLAEFFRGGDRALMAGTGGPRLYVPETEIMVDRKADILVTETEMRSRNGACIGVHGYFVDVTGLTILRTPLDRCRDVARLPEIAGLTPPERQTLAAILHNGRPSGAGPTSTSVRREGDAHALSIRKKLQCATNDEVVSRCIRAGVSNPVADR